jgi:hypothetical protein
MLGGKGKGKIEAKVDAIYVIRLLVAINGDM